MAAGLDRLRLEKPQACCRLHRPGITWGGRAVCCDSNDCGPCCEDCPTCPTLRRQREEATS